MTTIPFSRPYFGGGEGAALAEVVESRWVAQGPTVRRFEDAFAERVGAAHAVALTNCTSALMLALLVEGVGPGDEVVLPSLSFIATANAVVHCGATPVFADVEAGGYNLDPAAADGAITPRTRAILCVHQIGLPCDLDELSSIAERRGVALVEDAACAVGADYKGAPVGSAERLACFSLHARKVITTGEGGMITTGDGARADRLRKLRQHCMSVSDVERHTASKVAFETYGSIGYNFRMTDLQAALGLCQLGVLDEILAARRRLADRYSQRVAAIEHVEPPTVQKDRTHAFQSYSVMISEAAPITREELMQRLLDDGIATRRGVMAIHHEPPYADPAPDLPRTEGAARHSLLLPMFPELTDDQQDRVLERLATHLAAA